jgi:[ribosomal protein S18]-alanine N-acetyltransferase
VSERSVRDMAARDIPLLLEIERASFITPWTAGMFMSQLRFEERTINLVLVEGEAIAGYAAAALAFDEMHLLSIAVAPERRRRGLAAELLREAMARSRARGASRVILEVREGNEAARAFYRSRGFAEIGRRRAYYVDTGEDAIVMAYEFDS